MLTVRPYNEEYPEHGNVYKVSAKRRAISVERTDVDPVKSEGIIVNVHALDSENIEISLSVNLDEVDELMLALLAVKKEIEEG